MPNTNKKQSVERTWSEIECDILSRLDIAVEAESLGVRFSADRPSESGWRSCHAIDRADGNPSAAICVESSSGCLGRYRDLGGDDKAISFWDLAVVAGKSPDWRTARGFFADKVGVVLPRQEKIVPEKLQASIEKQLQIVTESSSQQLAKVFAVKWVGAKPGLTVDSVLAAGALPAKWPKTANPPMDVFAFRSFDPSDWSTPIGFLLYRISGQDFPAATGRNGKVALKARKAHLLKNSTDGLIVVGGHEKLKAATVVWLTEGLPDAISLASRLPGDHAAVTSTNGATSFGKFLGKAFAGKCVHVVMDADKPGESGALLRARVICPLAEVKIITLPFESTKNHGRDLRDFFTEGHSFEELLKIADEADTVAIDEAEADSDEKDPGFVKVLSDLICEDNWFARDAGGRLYRYRDGAYRSKAEEFIQRKVKNACIILHETKKWSVRLSKEVVAFIAVDSPHLQERPPFGVLNVSNGLVQLSSGALLEHSPEHLSPVQLPVKYDPKATCPELEKIRQ